MNADVHTCYWSLVANILLLTALGGCGIRGNHRVSEESFNFPPRPGLPGIVTIIVTDYEKKFTKFEMNLKEGRGSSIHIPGGNFNLLDCAVIPALGPTELRSPNGEGWASCSWATKSVIKDSRDEEIANHTFDPDARLSGIAWSPDSNGIAVLVEQEKSDDLSLRGMFGLMFGHPLLLTRYRLFLFFPSRNDVEELPFISNYIEGAWAAVQWRLEDSAP